MKAGNLPQRFTPQQVTGDVAPDEAQQQHLAQDNNPLSSKGTPSSSSLEYAMAKSEKNLSESFAYNCTQATKLMSSPHSTDTHTHQKGKLNGREITDLGPFAELRILADSDISRQHGQTLAVLVLHVPLQVADRRPRFVQQIHEKLVAECRWRVRPNAARKRDSAQQAIKNVHHDQKERNAIRTLPVEARAVQVHATYGVTANQRNNFLVIEALGVEDVANVVSTLGSIR